MGYPTGVVSFTTHNAGDVIQPADVNSPGTEIVAIETGLLNGAAHNFKPLTDDTYSLGDSGHRWLKAWLQDADIDGTVTLANPLAVASGGTGQSSNGTAGQVLGSTGSGLALVGGLTLLHQGSGTDTTATATTVDSFSVSGLTVKDTLLVWYNLESITQSTANVVLYQTTDPVTVVSMSGGSTITANLIMTGKAQIQARQGSTSALQAVAEGMNSSSARVDAYNNPSYTTAWTGTWTFGLRHGGVTSGGTFKYVWAVYKLAGQ